MTVAEWLAYARADAQQRGLPDLVPALEALAKATEQLRRADWNEDSSAALPASPGAAGHLGQGDER